MASLYKYEFDRLGNNPTNKVVEEPKSLVLSDPKAVYLKYGLAYADSIVITDAAKTPLTLGSDYHYIADDPFVTAETGLETAAGIRLTDNNFVGDLLITYQAVGGSEGQSSEFAKRLAQAIEDAVANPSVSWVDIKDKPIFYPPALHKHPPSQLDDLGLLSQRLDEVTLALRDRRPLHDSYHNVNENYERLLRIVAGLQNSINQIVAVTGSAKQISDLQDRLTELHKELSFDREISAGIPTEVWSADIGSFSFLTGTLVYEAGVKRHIVTVDVTHDSATTKWSRYGKYLMQTNTDLFTINITSSGGKVRMSIVPTENGKIKAKWVAQI